MEIIEYKNLNNRFTNNQIRDFIDACMYEFLNREFEDLQDVINMEGHYINNGGNFWIAIDEFNGIRGDFYKNMFEKCPAGRPGTADEVANVAELLMTDKGAFITGADFLIDGGATASYFYGSLKPENN